MTWMRSGAVMLAAMSLAGLTMLADSGTGPRAEPRPLQDQSTLTGCLRVGSAPSVLLLRGATRPGTTDVPDAAQIPRDYLLVSVPDDLETASHVNHRVAITGQVSDARSGPSPPDAANTAERALRRLSVTGLQPVAEDCG